MITDIEDYFSKGCGRCERFATLDCSTRRWAYGLNQLRRICLESALIETVKWGHPCYMHAGRNVVIIGAFRGDFRVSFFNAALMKDPEGVLEKQGPNARYRNMIRFADNAQAARMEPTIQAYLKEAMAYADAGIMPPSEDGGVELPDELIAALNSDPVLADAFYNLTPGRQRSYVIQISSTKTPAIRTARIAKFRGKILAGKGASER